MATHEDTPRNTLRHLGGKEDAERVGKEHDEDECVQEHETEDGSITVSDPAGDRSSHEDTDERAQWPANLQGGLPRTLKDVAACRVLDTVLLLEGWESDEGTHQEETVRLHDLQCARKQSTEAGDMSSMILTMVDDMVKAHAQAAG